jgi:hypothetical protein
MLAKIYFATDYGVDAYEIEIELNRAGGDPNIVIVGFDLPIALGMMR